MKPIGKCKVVRSDHTTIQSPMYLKVGAWCLTAPLFMRNPRPESGILTITHMPTGVKAGDMMADDPHAAKTLVRFGKLFGRSKTVKGLMAKYRKFPRAKKEWLMRQQIWK
jgi:hypothetical protein